MNNNSIKTILTIIIFSLCRLSFEVCPVNRWCGSLRNVSAFEYKFVVRTSSESMSWFDAIQLCRNDGGGAELFSLESAVKRDWLRTELEAFLLETRVLAEKEAGASLWLFKRTCTFTATRSRGPQDAQLTSQCTMKFARPHCPFMSQFQ